MGTLQAISTLAVTEMQEKVGQGLFQKCNVYFAFFVKMMNLRFYFWQLFSNYRNGGC